jgi:hypothetical protein
VDFKIEYDTVPLLEDNLLVLKNNETTRAGHFRYFYRSSDIRYLLDTGKGSKYRTLKVSEGRISGHQISTFDSPILSDTEKNIGIKKRKKWHCIHPFLAFL